MNSGKSRFQLPPDAAVEVLAQRDTELTLRVTRRR